MAKWGEGDPRWIVEERPDATNVNNWHWTEKNASQWSKDKLKELLVGLEITNANGKCKITDMTKIEGEASANNRKAKLIFFYEWTIKLEWNGMVNGNHDEVKGEVEIPNLSEENSLSEVDIIVSVKNSSKEATHLREIMLSDGVSRIREQISHYVDDLKKEFAAGMILPKRDLTGNSTDATVNKEAETKNPSKPLSQKFSSESATSKMNRLDIRGMQVETTELLLHETFKCTAEELYNVLTIKEMIQAFTHGPCIWEPRVGGRFQLFDGNVSGNFLKLEPNKQIQMTWRFSGWPPGHFSTVTLRLEQKEDCTDIVMNQTVVPVNDLDRTKIGWNRYYWESIKKTFGFGAMLF